MNEFVASNGRVITSNLDHYGHYKLGFGTRGRNGNFTVTDEEFDAFREFFRAEEDELLGRWRWPENPDYVVYPDTKDGSLITVLNEKEAQIRKLRRESYGLTLDYKQQFVACAEAYFEAHPEPKKPWEEAECGESWLLEPFGIVYTCVGDRRGPKGLWFTRANVFGHVENVQLDNKAITAGRRIWPEGDTE